MSDKDKIRILKEILEEEHGECPECIDARLDGYTICGDCSCK